MNRSQIWHALCVLPMIIAASEYNLDAVTIAWSPVGNPSNPADTAVMIEDGTTGYGAVPYAFNIGTYDVTNNQYVDFLNAKDPTGADPLGLYNMEMSSPLGGIRFSPNNAPGSMYSVISGDGNYPIVYETWFNAIRFANWMNNGQGNSSTETGAYTLLGGTPTPSNADSVTRNPGATIFLPSENEWYKAAYYNPATSSYFQYPTSSNTAPTATGPTSASNSANYLYVVGSVTNVGAYSGTTSPYGAFDMGGNVAQWIEGLREGSNRVARGGGYSSGGSEALASSNRGAGDPATMNQALGFRLASIPEPSTAVLAALGGLALLVYRRRR
jgi:formylglycine-generating enzyme